MTTFDDAQTRDSKRDVAQGTPCFDATAKHLETAMTSEKQVQRQSADVQMSGITGGTVLPQVIRLCHESSLIRPLNADRVLFFIPRRCRSVVKNFGRHIRIESEITNQDFMSNIQIVAIASRIVAVNPAEFDPVFAEF